MSKPIASLRELERSLAYENAASTIDCNCTPVPGEVDWFDISDVNPHAGGAINDAVLYLELRGLLERDPANLNHVSVRNEEEEPASVVAAGM